jgi:asparagine synthase (glutamine-hydrolysing)
VSAFLGRVEFSDRAVSKSVFDRALKSLAFPNHQPPISVFDRKIAVGCTMHQITSDPLPSPRSIDDEDLIVVCDSILDNRTALGRQLGLSCQETATKCDAFLVRASYEKWGQLCPNYIEGDFAFAIVNKRTREIFLARDHIGSRPLYWTRQGQSFVFGSSIEAIVDFDDLSWSIDQSIVAEFLLLPGLAVSKPFFSELQTVSPGASLSYNGERVTERKWWHPSVRRERRKTPAADIVAECRHLLETSIDVRTRSHRPIGSHFSAGIDSTAITVLAHRILKDKGRGLEGAYAWAPPVSEDYPLSDSHDERNLIEAVATREGIRVHYGSANGTVISDFQKRPIEYENETDLSDEIPVIEKAESHGIGIMLSGWGGDEAFSSHGFGYLGHLLLTGQLRQAKRFTRHRPTNLRSMSGLSSLLWTDLIQPSLPNSLYHLSKRRSAIRLPTCMSHELAAAFPKMLWKRNSMIKFGTNPNQNMLRHLTAGHITRRMESWAVLSAQHGFQYRYPLTDRRLLEFILTLAPNHLYYDTEPRGLARQVLSDIVPREANKNDHTNEAFRWNAIIDAWHLMKREASGDGFSDDCAWIEKATFLNKASHPEKRESPDTDASLNALSVLSARRVWELHRRARDNGWV